MGLNLKQSHIKDTTLLDEILLLQINQLDSIKILIFFSRNGNPLFLCKKTYDKIYNDWLTHSLIETIYKDKHAVKDM